MTGQASGLASGGGGQTSGYDAPSPHLGVVVHISHFSFAYQNNIALKHCCVLEIILSSLVPLLLWVLHEVENAHCVVSVGQVILSYRFHCFWHHLFFDEGAGCGPNCSSRVRL